MRRATTSLFVPPLSPPVLLLLLVARVLIERLLFVEDAALLRALPLKELVVDRAFLPRDLLGTAVKAEDERLRLLRKGARVRVFFKDNRGGSRSYRPEGTTSHRRGRKSRPDSSGRFSDDSITLF